MNLKLEGIYLLSNSHNPIINNTVGKVAYSQQMGKFIFKLFEHENPEYVGDYVVNPLHLTRISVAEYKLMQENKIYIKRPAGM
jgi:hypothetical protein